jgi:hypothetical protein
MSNHVHNWEHVPTASSDKCSRYKCACGKWARKQWTAKGLQPLAEYKGAAPLPEWFEDWADERKRKGEYTRNVLSGPARDEGRQ